MRYDHLGNCRTIDSYIKQKLNRLDTMEHSFETLFALMFSEKDGIMYERSEGYRMVKTTYGEAHDGALRRASGLRTLLKDAPQDAVVGIYMDNSEVWIETFWAVLAAGFSPLLLNLRLDPATLAQALTDCGAVAVIADPTLMSAAAFSLPTFDSDALLTDGTGSAGRYGSTVYVMSTGTSSRVKVCGYGAKEFCALVNDSVYIIAHCAQIKRHYNGKLKQLTFLPFYHVFGLIAMYIWFAFFSRTFVHLGGLEPETVLNTIRRHEVTHIFAVPLFWEKVYEKAMKAIADRGEETAAKFQKGVAISRKLDAVPALAKAFRKAAFKEVREQMFGDSVQFMITGGSPIREDVLCFFNDIGYHLTNGYGMTEIGITSVELSRNARKRNTASVGSPLQSVEYRISEDGELLVRGASLAKTVRVGDHITHRTDDWFHTGDLAEEQNGCYRILGRRDDLILLPNGEMLNPNLIEPRFMLLPEVTGVCLIDAGEDGKTVPILLLSVKKALTEEQLENCRKAANEQLKACRLDTQIKATVFVAGHLIGETDFKVNRRTLTQQYLAGKLHTVSPETAAAEGEMTTLARQVAAIFAAALNRPAEQITLTADFFTDLDGTSLDFFAMLSALKETFSLPFEISEEHDLHTVESVCRYMEERR